MEAHAALPQPDQPRRIGQQFRRIEQRIAKPAAEDDSQRGIEEQVVGMALRQWCARLADHPPQLEVGQHDPRQIGEAVPLDREEPEVDRDRRKAEVLPMQRLVTRNSCGCGGR